MLVQLICSKSLLFVRLFINKFSSASDGLDGMREREICLLPAFRQFAVRYQTHRTFKNSGQHRPTKLRENESEKERFLFVCYRMEILSACD